MSDDWTTDRGFTLGHGLFETVLFEAGELQDLAAHLDRLRRGCAVLGLPPPDPQACESALRAAVAALPQPARRAAVRLNWSAGVGHRGLNAPDPLRPRLSASAAATPSPPAAMTLRTVEVRRNEGSPASYVKSLSYLDNVLARGEATRAGADEALMLNNRGEIACAAAANVFWLSESRLCTPAIACGVLAGTMRARVLAWWRAQGWPAAEVRQGAKALAGAEGIFLTNSLLGVCPVSEHDGRELGWPEQLSRLRAEVSA
ncbi:aminotransferase class IV [Phenylobacterium hankyongense]|uniref:aminotransferase class IV n=1 Tax=Phenylobacterium hankyongense TaxID=1813876 RepID=UPI0014021014|nr:aminotransferase class IV [Phenylobacterium hankyongense]